MSFRSLKSFYLFSSITRLTSTTRFQNECPQTSFRRPITLSTLNRLFQVHKTNIEQSTKPFAAMYIDIIIYMYTLQRNRTLSRYGKALITALIEKCNRV